MPNEKLRFCRFTTTSPPINPPLIETAGGWGDLYNNGAGITGGQGGTSYSFSNFEDLLTAIGTGSANPANSVSEIFYYTGPDITQPPTVRTFNEKNNKSIIFTNGQEWKGGSLFFNNCNNFVIKNVYKFGPYSLEPFVSEPRIDHFTVNGSWGIWFDHCTFDGENRFGGNSNDFSDGMIDIGNSTTRSSDKVVISNCIFKNSDKAILIGYGVNEAFRGFYNVTIRNSIFENINLRSPLGRYGKIHLLDNYYRWVPDWYTWELVAPFARWVERGEEVQIYAQRCYFENGKRLTWQDTPTGGIKFDDVFIGNFDDAGTTIERSPELVTWNPNTLEGYTYPVLLPSPTQSRDYTIANAGANLIIEP